MNKLILKSATALMAATMIATSAIAAAPNAAWAKTSVSAAPAQTEEDKGVLIAKVQKDGPAAKAGLKRGDILISLDGKAVNSVDELMTAASALKPSTTVTMTALRGDAERTLTVTVGDRNGAGYLGLTPAGDEGFSRLPMPKMDIMKMGQTVIEAVVKDSPADKAGLKKGEIILSVDGTVLTPTVTLPDLIGKKKPGDSVTLQVQASGTTTETRDVKVTLGDNPDKKGTAWLGVQYRSRFGLDGRGHGGRGMPLPEGTTDGAVVGAVSPDSPAAKAGLAERDVITEIDGKAVSEPKTVVEAVQAHKIGDTVTLKVQRGTETKEIKVTLAENPNDKGKPFMGVQLGGYFKHVVPDSSGSKG